MSCMILIQISCVLFYKLILPILMYSSEVWGFHTAPDIEKVHLYFCKRVLRLKKSTANYFVYGELGRYPLYVHRLLRIIKYWLKVVMHKPNPLVHSMYLELCRQIHPVNSNNWASMVKKLLSELGFGHVWLQQGVGNLNGFMRMCKQRVSDQYVSKWNSQLNESSDALLYREIKTVFEYSSYLKDISVPRHRYALLRFLCKNSRIPVVTGKWQHPRPYHLRLCENCGILGDEFHFVFSCTIFEELRLQYIPRYYRINPSMVKFIEILKSQHKKTIRNLSIFLFKAMNMQ
jgi:hypothetical protein